MPKTTKHSSSPKKHTPKRKNTDPAPPVDAAAFDLAMQRIGLFSVRVRERFDDLDDALETVQLQLEALLEAVENCGSKKKK